MTDEKPKFDPKDRNSQLYSRPEGSAPMSTGKFWAFLGIALLASIALAIFVRRVLEIAPPQ